jgi:ABC-2 type transport system ATP-binding protein
MLKGGRVVALDSTSALIKRISGSQLVVNLGGGKLPDGLIPLVTHPDELLAGGKYTLRVNGYPEVEPILRALREAGAEIADMQLQQADLEDVFIQIMESEK